MTFIEIRLEEGTFEDIYEHLSKAGMQYSQRNFGLDFSTNLKQLNTNKTNLEWVVSRISSEKQNETAQKTD